jgi:periplasmic copper chaperone A
VQRTGPPPVAWLLQCAILDCGSEDIAINPKTLPLMAAMLVAALTFSPAGGAGGGVHITQAWVRATAPGQSVAGAFMEFNSTEDAALVSVTSPLAGAVEMHTMKIEGGVMKMRAVDRIELPAGQPVKLAPGGYHLMLIDITRQLRVGDSVPLSVTVEARNKAKSVIEVNAAVREYQRGPRQEPAR